MCKNGRIWRWVDHTVGHSTLNKKIIRAFVDMHIHIADMHRATFCHMLCVFYDQFGAFSMVNLALKCTTRAVLRLECSLDCISGSPTNIFIFSLSAFLLKLKKCNYKKCNWVSGSPSILYKLVLSPVPIVHTNFQENLQLVSPII